MEEDLCMAAVFTSSSSAVLTSSSAAVLTSSSAAVLTSSSAAVFTNAFHSSSVPVNVVHGHDHVESEQVKQYRQLFASKNCFILLDRV